MSALEEEYLRRISYKLQNFKAKGNHVYNFRCPICSDSEKKKNKARGYAFDKSGSLVIWCHNCNHEFRSIDKFLQHLDPLLYKEYVLEKFKHKQNMKINHSNPSPVQTKKYIPNIFDGLDQIKDLDDAHPAKKYCIKRKIPIDKFEFYYVEKFIEWTWGNTDKFLSLKEKSFEEHERIIIPFRARDKHIVGYTARVLGEIEPKYYRIFIDNDEKEKFFGIDRINNSKPILVVEGEIDSLFLDNCIAVSNGKLDAYPDKNAIKIPDIDRRNPHIMNGVKKLIDSGHKVCMLPEDLPGKDINEMIQQGLTQDQIQDIIMKNVYQGLEAQLKFNKWRIAK